MVFQLKSDIYKFTNFDLKAKIFSNEKWKLASPQGAIVPFENAILILLFILLIKFDALQR